MDYHEKAPSNKNWFHEQS